MCKRIFDYILALAGLMIALPLMGLIVLAIKLETPGPAIFSQTRLAKGGNTFRMHKFRKFPHHMPAGSGVTMRGDVRMTRVGRFLERTKLDELPQLWNILKGEMSFVGPRPESLVYKDLFHGGFSGVLDYTPGIFGPNQVAFRNEAELYPADENPEHYYRRVLFPQKARNDLDYFVRSHCLQDLRWIVQGVWVTVSGVLGWRRFFGLHRLILGLDGLAVITAWLAANLLRHQGLPAGRAGIVFDGMWLLPLVMLPLMIVGGCYRTPARFFSVTDVPGFVRKVTLFWLFAFFVFISILHRNSSLGAGLLSYLLVLLMMLLPRLFYHAIRQPSMDKPLHTRYTLLIYGADRQGQALAQLLSGLKSVQVVGFVDDDPELLGHKVGNREVLGSERDLVNIHAVFDIEQLWLAFIPEEEKYKRLQAWCLKHNVKLVSLLESEAFKGLCCE